MNMQAIQALSMLNKSELKELKEIIECLLDDDIKPLVLKLSSQRQKLLAVKIVKSLYSIELIEAKKRVDAIVEDSRTCNKCKSGLINYPSINRRTCTCGAMGYNIIT